MAQSPPLARNCIVHIGLNKTGSTTLQLWLATNAKTLRGHGIWFDDLAPHDGPELSTALGWAIYAATENPNWDAGPWQKQAYGLHSPAARDARIAAFLSRVEVSLPTNAETYVTSSEAIGASVRKPAQIARLHAWFTQRFAKVTYIVYIRDQVDWVASAYVQAVRSGSTLSLDRFIEKNGRNNYMRLVRTWRQIVGKHALVVRRLDKLTLRNGDLIEDFASQIGVPADAFQIPPRQNESMTAFRAGLTRRVSLIFGGAIHTLGLIARQRRLYNRPFPNPMGLRKLTLSPTQAARVRAINAESNEALRSMLFPQDRALFPSALAVTQAA